MSKKDGWLTLLRNERDKLKLDPKSKIKRFILNRLLAQGPEFFNQQVYQLIEQINDHMSNTIPIHWNNYSDRQVVESIYSEVKNYRMLQNQQGLLHVERDQICNLFVLQEGFRFLELVSSSSNHSNAEQTDANVMFQELFDHSLIIVDHPSGLECPAVVKYELNEEKYEIKIKTRLICLLDPQQVGQYLKMSNIEAILYAKDSENDPNENIKLSLSWKFEKIMDTANTSRTFLYCELTEDCPITFVVNSQLFAICSHPQLFPQYLAKVLIIEMNNSSSIINYEQHVGTLMNYINLYHQRVCGIKLNDESHQFIVKQLENVYLSSHEKISSLSFDIYEHILSKLIAQIRFMSNHPFLCTMYHEGLFHGICDAAIDQNLRNGTRTKPYILIRFDTLDNQTTACNQNLIFAINNGELCKAEIESQNLAEELCQCFHKAASIKSQAQMYNHEILSFENLRFYYDEKMQTVKKINYYPLNLLLRDKIQPVDTNPLPATTTTVQDLFPINSEAPTQYSAILSLNITANRDLRPYVITYLQQALSQLCSENDITGVLDSFSSLELLDHINPSDFRT
ncbi:hypothetical protein I4U23_025501 [Adineta vaga]|nr:hypothetical protein I4U23_025501 [Adineta vaga]